MIMPEKENAILGSVVRDFTYAEEALKSVGSYIDELITLDDAKVFKEKVGEMWFKIRGLATSVEDFSNDVQKYLLDDTK